jgi:hypothetical protein
LFFQNFLNKIKCHNLLLQQPTQVNLQENILLLHLLSGSTIANGGIEVKPNIKYKEVIKKVATSGLIVDGTCDFTNAGTVTLTERIIQPEEFQVNLELCKTPFESDWDAISMGYSAFDNLPPAFSDFLNRSSSC